MSRATIERKLQSVLVRAVSFALKCQQPNGLIAITPNYCFMKMLYDQQIVAAMAYCLARRFPGNPYFRSKKLGSALQRAIRYLIDIEGRGAQVTGPTSMPLEHRALAALILADRYAADQLAPRLREDLERLFDASLRYTREHIKRHAGVRAFDAHTLHTGTNHFWGYVGIMAMLAQRNGELDVLEPFRPWVERFALAQDVTGHWTENFGPATVYTRVSAQFVGRVADVLGGAILRRAARKAADFQMTFAFPDGTGIECFDERMMQGERFYRESQHAFGWNALPYSPKGPAYFAAMIDPMLAQCEKANGFVSLEFTHGIVEALERIDRLATAPRPWRPRDGAAHGDGFGTVRRAPWQIGYQVMPTRSWPANPFFLDRQNLFSLWHDRCGRLVNGSNSKRQPDVATFTVLENSGEEFLPLSDYLPLRGRWQSRGKLGAIEAEYRSFNASIEFLPKNDRGLVVRVRAKPRRRIARLAFNVILPFEWGQAIRCGGGAAFVLGEDRPDAITRSVDTWLSNGMVRFSASKPFQCTWPFNAFSSYHAPLNQRAPCEGWFVASFVLDPKNASSFDLRFDAE